MAQATADKEERRSCAQYSKAAAEEISGTVKPVDLWLLIEYRARWPREAVSVLSSESQRRLGVLRNTIPSIRLALIRRPDRVSGKLTAYWAFSRERGAQLFRTEFFDYEELSFDIDELGIESSEKMFAVCTHGTHDLCCAQFGNEIYAEMRTNYENVWQISHIGGCRFAPNVVCLPHGVVYGRVERADCSRIVSTYTSGALFEAKLRGRSCYSKAVQAAERFLRHAVRLTAIEDLRVINVEQPDKDHWFVDFLREGPTKCRVSICLEAGQPGTYKSCSATVTEPREKFALVALN
jgi:hypothetical protein